MSTHESKHTFFRQGAWVLIATLLSGIFMFATHFFSLWMEDAEYGLFATLLQFLSLMRIPTLGLQTVFTQSTAASVHPSHQQQLTGAIRTLLLWTFLIWLTLLLGAIVFQGSLLETFKIDDPIALWITVALGLPQLWLSILGGVLQGQQKFLWVGMVYILHGMGRFIAVGVSVLLLHGEATGAIAGVLLGFLIALTLNSWKTREAWLGKGSHFEWIPWLKKVFPLTLGLGVSIFMLSADMIWVRMAFDESQTGTYARATLFGRGLVMFTIPLASVMFPKIVRSVALARRTDVLIQALAATALLAGCVAVFCTGAAFLIPWALDALRSGMFPISQGWAEAILAQKEKILEVGRLVPWGVWAMASLPLANALIKNLMARLKFETIPYLVSIPVLYAVTLYFFGDSLVGVLQILGAYNLLLVLLCVIVTFHRARFRAPH